MGLTFENQIEEDRTLPEDSIWPAVLKEIKSRTINWKDKNDGSDKSSEMLEWWWEITGTSQYAGRRIKGECDARLSTHPSNKLRNWASVLLEMDIPAGFKLDTDDLVGLPAEVSIGHRPDKKDPAKVWEFIDQVLPSTTPSEPPF